MAHRDPPRPFHETFTSTPLAIRDMLGQLRRFLARSGLAPDLQASVELVMAEVLNNVSRHAFGIETPGPVEVTARLCPDALRIVVTDTGGAMPDGLAPPGHLPTNETSRDQLPEGGFGWFLIRDLTDSVAYTREEEENRLDLRFTRKNSAE